MSTICGKEMTEDGRRELEMLYENAYEQGSGMGAHHQLLIAFLYRMGYSVTNTARAFTLAERILWGDYDE